jgi:hypothetical protein
MGVEVIHHQNDLLDLRIAPQWAGILEAAIQWPIDL